MVWMILNKQFCNDSYYGPYVGVAWAGTNPPSRELLVNFFPLAHHNHALWCGDGSVNVDIENGTFVGDGLIPERIPCDYVAPYERIADPDSPIVCCVGTIVTADQEDVVDCPKCKRMGSLPNPKWPF
jgi:hypothetical protein